MAEEFNIQINLIEEAQKHMAFIMDADAVSGVLHRPHVIRNAMRRYEKIWLPLVKENRFEELEAPFDIHWVWHVHMLCPLKYAADTQAVIGFIPDHKFFILKQEKQAVVNKSKELWQKHTSEPFDLKLETVSEECQPFDSVFTYNILEASDRQKEFYYNVSLPHFIFESFLETAIERYKKFVALKKKNRDAFLVPMYDIDFVWHTHQLCPLAYREDIKKYLGYIMDHDDSTTDRSPDSTLTRATVDTKTLWREEYPSNDPYFIPGVMYRGKNPRGALYTMSTHEQRSLYKPWYKVGVTKVELSGDVKEKYKICGSLYQLFHRACKNMPSQKGLPFIWESQHGTFANCRVCDSPNENDNVVLFVLYLKREDGIRGRLFGRELADMEFRVTTTTVEEAFQQQKSNSTSVSFHIDHTHQNDDCHRYKATIHMTAEMKEGPEDTKLSLRHDDFKPQTVTLADREFWGPVPLPRMAPNTKVKCLVASHSLVDYTGSEKLGIRVIHSVQLKMSVVQVFCGDKMAAVSHLVGAEQLPGQHQVQGYTSKCLTLYPALGQRAMLIKNNDGDWGMVRAHWEGFRKRVLPNEKGEGGKPGDPGFLMLSYQNVLLDSMKIRDIKLKHCEEFRLDGIHFDPTKSAVRVGMDSMDIAERIALCMSACVLYSLCEPRVSPPGMNKPLAGMKGTGAGMPLVRAMGYDAEKACNSWLYLRHCKRREQHDINYNDHFWQYQWMYGCIYDDYGYRKDSDSESGSEKDENDTKEEKENGTAEEGEKGEENDEDDDENDDDDDGETDAVDGGPDAGGADVNFDSGDDLMMKSFICCPWGKDDVGVIGGGGDDSTPNADVTPSVFDSSPMTAACGGCTASCGDGGGYHEEEPVGGVGDGDGGGGGGSSCGGGGGHDSGEGAHDSGGGGDYGGSADAGGGGGGGGGCASTCASSGGGGGDDGGGGGGGGCGSSCGGGGGGCGSSCGGD